MSSSLLKICVYSLEKGTSYNFVGISNTHGAEWSNGLNDQCIQPDVNDNWWFDFSFYAINSTIRPIPYGVSLLTLERSSKNPNAVGKVHITQDIYNKIDNTAKTYFMVYITPTVGTKTLYIWENPVLDSSYFTFDRDYQPDSPDWAQNIISPVYVFDRSTLPFSCNNFKCIPYDATKNIYEQGKLYENYNECLSACALKGRYIDNMLTIPSLLDSITEPKTIETYSNTGQQTDINLYNLLTIFISIVCVILLVSIFYCILHSLDPFL